jgi:hypothetical protein
MFVNQNKPKISPQYYCEICDYRTSKKSNYNNHTKSNKHIKSTIVNENKLILSSKTYTCDKCNKKYKDNSGLWRHNKKCYFNRQIINNVINIDDNDSNIINNKVNQQQLIENLLKENSEFKQLMLEQNKQMLEQNKQMIKLSQQNNKLSHNIGDNNNINSNNSFNLNFFLNETCKNAMNIMDFVNQLHVGIKDLEETGRLGFSEGISKIFINGLKQIDINDRPVHCSDLKRETLYIKDNDQWSKDNENKTLLTNAIKHVAHKNIKQISQWTKEHPEYNDSTSKQNDKYLKIVCESMSGSTIEETKKNYCKIIKNIVKETSIDKDR